MGSETLSGIDDMINIKVYREYWEGVQKRIPEIKKVLPVTIDEEMSKTIQGLSKEECPVLFILIPSGTGASLSADNVRENNLCVIFLMSKYDLDLTSLSTLPESGFYRTFAGWSLAFSFKTRC